MQKKEDWSAAFFCFLVFFIFIGVQRSSGVFFIEIIHLFNIDRELASVPFTVQLLMFGLIGPFVGYLGTQYEPTIINLVGCFLGVLGIGLNFVARNIYASALFWGINGIGQGLSIMLIPVILNNFFNKYFSTACGIAFCGMGVGGIILPILSKTLIETYDVSGSFLIICGVALHLLPFMYMLHCKATRIKSSENYANIKKKLITCISERPLTDSPDLPCNEAKIITIEVSSAVLNSKNKMNPSAKETIPVEARPYEDIQANARKSFWYPFLIFFDATFWAILLVQGCLTGIFCFINTIFVDMYVEKNVRIEEAVYIIAGISTADIVGRVLIGRISDSGRITAVNLAVLCQILMMLAYLSLVWCRGLVACVIPSLVQGFTSGALWIVILPIVRNFMEKQNISMAMSSRSILSTPIIFAIPPSIGFFKDRMGSYDGLLFIFTAICLVCSIVTYFIPYLAIRRNERKLHRQTHTHNPTLKPN